MLAGCPERAAAPPPPPPAVRPVVRSFDAAVTLDATVAVRDATARVDAPAFTGPVHPLLEGLAASVHTHVRGADPACSAALREPGTGRADGRVLTLFVLDRLVRDALPRALGPLSYYRSVEALQRLRPVRNRATIERAEARVLDVLGAAEEGERRNMVGCDSEGCPDAYADRSARSASEGVYFALAFTLASEDLLAADAMTPMGVAAVPDGSPVRTPRQAALVGRFGEVPGVARDLRRALDELAANPAPLVPEALHGMTLAAVVRAYAALGDTDPPASALVATLCADVVTLARTGRVSDAGAP